MPFPLEDNVAVVTGAASGIGRATALALAARGCHLALADRDAEGLEATAAQAEERGVTVSRHPFDVTDGPDARSFPVGVRSVHKRAGVLVNNAGTSLVGRFEEVSMQEFRWLMEVNFFSVVEITKGFLPLLHQQPEARVVNVSSLFGLIAPAEQVAYAASKFAVRGFSEALRHELDGTTVGVTVVHPGGVRTGIARNGRVAARTDAAEAERKAASFTERALRLEPEAAAEAIVRGVERRKNRVLIGADARAGDALARLAPARYWSAVRSQYERITGA